MIAGIVGFHPTPKQLAGKACNGVLNKIEGYFQNPTTKGVIIIKNASKKRSINFSPETLDALDKLAAKNYTTTSELVRKYVEQGLSVDGNKENIDFIRKQIREELRVVMDGYMDRLVKILIRIGMPTITMNNYTSQLLHILTARHMDDTEYESMMNKARREATVYLGTRSELLDEACDNIMGKGIKKRTAETANDD